MLLARSGDDRARHRQEREVVEATIKETCNGAEFFVRGQNRANGNFEAIKLLDVESITF